MQSPVGRYERHCASLFDVFLYVATINEKMAWSRNSDIWLTVLNSKVISELLCNKYLN